MIVVLAEIAAPGWRKFVSERGGAPSAKIGAGIDPCETALWASGHSQASPLTASRSEQGGIAAASDVDSEEPSTAPLGERHAVSARWA
jgi:hypothetical protein